jgi:hypothetical protein
MMKKYLYFMLAGVAALASSCVKEPIQENNEEFRPGSVCVTASMDPETKATIAESDGAFRFSSGDAIMIFDGTAVKSGTTTSTESSGSFAMEDGFNAEGSGYAGFPASLVSGITASGVVFTLPTSYEYAAVGGSDPDAAKVPVPMIGTYTGGNTVSLKQAGALIRFRVTNVAAGSLTFTFPTNVTGTLGTAITTPSGTNDGILAANLSSAGKTITVTGVPETTSGNYIFITLPVPTGTATAGIKVFNNGSSRMSAPTGSSTGLSRASGYKLGVYLGDNQGAKGGLFTVNASGDQVYFSQGNLQAVCTSADDDPDTQETWTWRLATNQYDYVGDEAGNNTIDGNGSVSAPGTVDLFGWSTDATYYGINNSESANDYSGSFRDWGALIGSGWRTLSKDEWNYIIVSRTGAATKYGFATVCDVNGIIILPDEFTDPMKNGGDGAFKGSSTKDWDANIYTSGPNWDAMESAGAIFLPHVGYRSGNSVIPISSPYWSSTSSDGDKAWRLVFNNNIAETDDNNHRNFGYSVRLVRDASNVPDQDPGMLSTPLTFEAKAAGAKVAFIQDPFLVNPPKFEYSTDGTIWNDYNADENITLDNIGDKVSFRAENSNGALYGYFGNVFTCDKDCYIYGNIMSLLRRDGFATMTSVPDNAFQGLFSENKFIFNHPSKALVLPATTLGSYCYQEMFKNCDALITAPVLPATSLAPNCYYMMFDDCDALTTAPALPATTLAEGCYRDMFTYCISLQTAPALPATALAKDCYHNMFKGCKFLINAPDLPATTLAEGCYREMFAYCTQLSLAPDLPATTLAKDCYNEMFSNCSSLNSVTCLATDISAEDCTTSWLDGVAASGTFIKAPSMTSWTLDSEDGIPSGWTAYSLVNLSSINVDALPTDPDRMNHKYYQTANGEALTGTLPNEVELYVPAGATVTLAGMTHHAGEYYHGLKCFGTANIILAAGTTNDLTRGDDNSLYGIFLNYNGPATLTIEGTGTLLASGGYGYSGISGNKTMNHIVINGGTITAMGGATAPGIGSKANNGKSGNITINGGTVTATGGRLAPGIGAGRQGNSQCGTITFNGGTTVATGGNKGESSIHYGIGAGDGSSCGNIYFNNGASGCSVTANGGVQNAAPTWIVFIDDKQATYEHYIARPFVYPIPTP